MIPDDPGKTRADPGLRGLLWNGVWGILQALRGFSTLEGLFWALAHCPGPRPSGLVSVLGHDLRTAGSGWDTWAGYAHDDSAAPQGYFESFSR